MSNHRRIAIALTVAVPLLLGASYWYMILCKGKWEGVPLEAGMKDELLAIEQRLRSDVSFLSETLGPRNPTHPASHKAAADWITNRWRSRGYEVRDQTFAVEGIPCSNLEIEIRGASRPSEIVLLSAQYDTWPDSPGANNNGSGMAVLLELSDMLREHAPDRTLRLVAFTTQEPPYSNTDDMGSLRYARRSRDLGEDIVVALSMDAIGIYKHEPGSQSLPWPFSLLYPDRGNYLGFISDLRSRKWVVTATRGFARGSSFPIEAGSVPSWVEGAAWSDHSSFWKNGYAGIQITDTGAFRAPESHTTSEDTIEKIDFAALARITVGMYGALLELTLLD